MLPQLRSALCRKFVSPSFAARVRALSNSNHSDGEDAGNGHRDFAPHRRAPANEGVNDAHEIIKHDIASSAVFVYMKGDKTAPRCGFSNQVVRILEHEGVPFEIRDVLADEAVRQGIKSFSGWPTIPQVFVHGEMIGGCDIVTQLFQSGELRKLLEEKGIVPAKQDAETKHPTEN